MNALPKKKLRTIMFGPVGNTKLVFLMIHVLYIFYEYPVYYIYGLDSFDDWYYWHILFYVLSAIMWYSLYAVHNKEPGYLRQNTFEYQSALRRVTNTTAYAF